MSYEQKSAAVDKVMQIQKGMIDEELTMKDAMLAIEWYQLHLKRYMAEVDGLKSQLKLNK